MQLMMRLIAPAPTWLPQLCSCTAMDLASNMGLNASSRQRTRSQRLEAKVTKLRLGRRGAGLTVNAAKWRQLCADLDEPLHVIEILDPDELEPEE
jgi:hypothetical protein